MRIKLSAQKHIDEVKVAFDKKQIMESFIETLNKSSKYHFFLEKNPKSILCDMVIIFTFPCIAVKTNFLNNARPVNTHLQKIFCVSVIDSDHFSAYEENGLIYLEGCHVGKFKNFINKKIEEVSSDHQSFMNLQLTTFDFRKEKTAK